MIKKLSALIPIVLFLASCATVPITGRQQLNLIPSGTMLAMSNDSYRDFLSKHKVLTDTEEAYMVKKAGRNIASAVEKYFAEQNMSDQLKGYKWEFNLVQDKSINAWAMPGGKSVVYTGILPYAKDETGLAVVLGHEIAHAVANHGEERMSQMLIAQLGGIALNVALSEKPNETNALFLAAYGLGAQVGVLLPFSRLHETEADRLGLIFMSMAGYDPMAAVEFWKGMAVAKKGSATFEFLSTHPADETRIRNIENFIPEALRYYKKQ